MEEIFTIFKVYNRICDKILKNTFDREIVKNKTVTSL